MRFSALSLSLNLPPLSKGGGLTARHKLLLHCVCLQYIRLFYLPNFSAVKTEGLPHHQPFQTRTILLAFRRVSVCVSLYGFVFALSLPLFVGEELAPPVAPNTAITTTVAKSQPPLAPHHVLASPRKRVRFCCSVKPSQLWWGLLPIRTINEIFRTIPITKLASLVKGRWLDGKAQTVASLRLLAIYPPFLFAKLFCRQDGGIATPPLAHTNPPKTALSLSLFVG